MPDFSIIFFYVIAPIIVVTIIMVVRSSKHKSSQTNNSVQTPKSQSAKKKDEPSSDILETIRKYTEITTNPSGMDQCEKIRICDEMLSEYEWYQSHVNCCDNWLANVNALWNAVCSYDLYYEGSEYEYSLMSNLFLMIQEKKRH